jgi:hypothetical protein
VWIAAYRRDLTGSVGGGEFADRAGGGREAWTYVGGKGKHEMCEVEGKKRRVIMQIIGRWLVLSHAYPYLQSPFRFFYLVRL